MPELSEVAEPFREQNKCSEIGTCREGVGPSTCATWPPPSTPARARDCQKQQLSACSEVGEGGAGPRPLTKV
jgi:hypothetical protein